MTFEDRVRNSIRNVPNWPREGILFRDITGLLVDPDLLALCSKEMSKPWAGRVDAIVSIEARGFIFGAACSVINGCGMIPLRKPGKLPPPVDRWEYKLEYGTDILELSRDLIQPGDRVAIVDDVCATGGTVEAAIELVRSAGADVVAASFLINLPDLGGAARIRSLDVPVNQVLTY